MTAMASAGPYTKYLPITPDRQPSHHLITQFLQAGYSSDTQPTNQPTVSNHESSLTLASSSGPQQCGHCSTNSCYLYTIFGMV